MATKSTDEGVRYRHKVVIVTGGGQGIGQGCVQLFGNGKHLYTHAGVPTVRHGSKVMIADINVEAGQQLQDNLNKEGYPGEAMFVKCDVTKESDVKELIQTAVATYGRIDCVINNAGNSSKTTMDSLTTEEFKDLNDLMILAAFQVSKHALPYIREVHGNIINICSIAGVLGQGQRIAYTTQKAALIGMTKAMAIDESKHGVRVNSISPGPVWTPMFDRTVHSFPRGNTRQEYRAHHQTFLGRLGTVEDVAKAGLFLAADAAYCTGINLHVSAGAELDFGLKGEEKILDLLSK